VRVDERQGSKNRVTKTSGYRLDRVAERCWSDLATEVFEDVRLSRRDDEADLARAAFDHSLHQILADGARSFTAVIAAAADRQQLLRKREWLNAAANTRRRHDSPHD